MFMSLGAVGMVHRQVTLRSYRVIKKAHGPATQLRGGDQEVGDTFNWQ